MALAAWVCVSLSSVATAPLAFVGVGRSTAVMGGLRGCWAVDVVRWVLAVVRRLPSPLRVVVNWAVVVFYAARFVGVGVCVTWQRATWRVHSLSLTLVTWACDRRAWLSGGHRGLWAASDVRGGGVTCRRRGGRLLWRWWLWEEERSRVTVCDACDFGSTFERARAITLGSRSCPNLYCPYRIQFFSVCYTIL